MSEMEYAGFWRRLGSLIIDGFILIPLMGPIMWFWQMGGNSTPMEFLISTIVTTLIGVVYHVGMHGKYGQTVGKMLMRIQVRKLNFSQIGYYEAFLRHSVNIALGIVSLIITAQTLFSVPPEAFIALNWQDRATFISTPTPQYIMSIITQVWVWGEVVIMLTNRKRRAPHDFIAGTVVVRVN